MIFSGEYCILDSGSKNCLWKVNYVPNDLWELIWDLSFIIFFYILAESRALVEQIMYLFSTIQNLYFLPSVCSGWHLETQYPKFKSRENKDLFEAFYCNWVPVNNLLIREDKNFSHFYQVYPVGLMPCVVMASTTFPFVMSLDISIV